MNNEIERWNSVPQVKFDTDVVTERAPRALTAEEVKRMAREALKVTALEQRRGEK